MQLSAICHNTHMYGSQYFFSVLIPAMVRAFIASEQILQGFLQGCKFTQFGKLNRDSEFWQPKHLFNVKAVVAVLGSTVSGMNINIFSDLLGIKCWDFSI